MHGELRLGPKPWPNLVEHKPTKERRKKKVEFQINKEPNRKKKRTRGSGAINVVNPANSAVAPTVPILSYIAPENSGKTAANAALSAAFAAIADAATGRYATTRYVSTDVNTKYIPAPNGTEARIGAIQ